MAGPVSEAGIDARLKEWGLTRDEHSSHAPALSKNRTIFCRQGRSRRVLVKVADTPSSSGVLREGAVLGKLTPLVSRPGCPLRLPSLFAFDPAVGLLAVEWLSKAETLHHYHRRSRRYGAQVIRQVGRGIGFLHRLSEKVPQELLGPEALHDDFDLLECFLRMRPDFYARLSPAGIELVGAVQRDGAALFALQALSEAQRKGVGACLLHGDLRQANLLRVNRSAGPRVVFLDWELSLWGDPARDLGSLVADYALGWMAPERESDVLDRPSLQAVVRHLHAAYRQERGRRFALDEPFCERVVQWTGVALLFYVYGMTHYEGEYSERGRRLAGHALTMLGTPDAWLPQLWGAP